MGEEHAEQQGERRQRLLAARQQRHDLQALARRARHDLQAGGQRILGFGELQVRSEEHTSELQSLMRISYAGFCLKTKKRYKLTKETYIIQRVQNNANISTII